MSRRNYFSGDFGGGQHELDEPPDASRYDTVAGRNAADESLDEFNDETFGADDGGGDWEADHEVLVEAERNDKQFPEAAGESLVNHHNLSHVYSEQDSALANRTHSKPQLEEETQYLQVEHTVSQILDDSSDEDDENVVGEVINLEDEEVSAINGHGPIRRVNSKDSPYMSISTSAPAPGGFFDPAIIATHNVTSNNAAAVANTEIQHVTAQLSAMIGSPKAASNHAPQNKASFVSFDDFMRNIQATQPKQTAPVPVPMQNQNQNQNQFEPMPMNQSAIKQDAILQRPIIDPRGFQHPIQMQAVPPEARLPMQQMGSPSTANQFLAMRFAQTNSLPQYMVPPPGLQSSTPQMFNVAHPSFVGAPPGWVGPMMRFSGPQRVPPQPNWTQQWERHPIQQDSIGPQFRFATPNGAPHVTLLRRPEAAQPPRGIGYPNVSGFRIAAPHKIGDPYAGLMTQRDRDSVIRVQLLQLNSFNNYADDYFYIQWRMRKLAANASGARLILPLGMQHEPTDLLNIREQPSAGILDGALGKVTKSSIHNPRRVIEIDAHPTPPAASEKWLPSVYETLAAARAEVSETDELRRLRRLLLEIEQLLELVLEIEDTEYKLHGLPPDRHAIILDERRERITTLFNRLAILAKHGLLAVRKGRTLVSRTCRLLDTRQVDRLLAMLSEIARESVSLSPDIAKFIDSLLSELHAKRDDVAA